MRKNFYSFPETITADNLEELKELVGDTKVGYSAIVLVRDLSYKGMPTYKIFVSPTIKASESIMEFIGQTGKTKITHSHMWSNENPARIFVHSHKRGDIPHGHNGARYNKVENKNG